MKKLIEMALLRKDISKKEFARLLNISHAHLDKIFRNGYIPTIDMLIKMSKILEIPTDLLLLEFDRKAFLISSIDGLLARTDLQNAENALTQILKFIKPQ